MAQPLEQFVKNLEDSGIIASETIKEFLPPHAEPKDAEDLARELFRKKKLTKFQAEEVYRGKGKSLTLGNYVLLEKIGAGGMGQVFKARHRRMDRIVAVKLLPASMTKDNAAIARFEREVRAAAKLRHPNIVAADDADCANGVHFLVMEFVDGSDLSALVKKNGPFALDKAVHYILQAARGLEAAHAEGIVHRDIKPANLLLDKKGTIKILDMGLARFKSESDGAGGAAPTELTSTGMVMGTVDYMAPEQALDTRTADARADIYSLGCALFNLATGKSTYSGSTMMAVLVAHREKPVPSLRAHCPEASEWLDAVFQKMIAKSPAERYQSAAELIADLERAGARPEASVMLQASLVSSGQMEIPDFLKDISLVTQEPRAAKKTAKSSALIQAGSWKIYASAAGGVLALLILVVAAIYALSGPRPGQLELSISDPGADVQILDKEGKKTEYLQKVEKGVVSLALPAGKHQLKINKEGFQPFAREFDIEAGASRQLAAKLTAVAAGKTVEKTIVQSNTPPLPPIPSIQGTQGQGIAEKPTTLVFNGRDFDGFERIGNADAWSIDPPTETLIALGTGGMGWLLTQKEYGDFQLQLEYELSAGCNSGVVFLAQLEDQPFLEIQLADAAQYPSGSFWSNPLNRVNTGFLPPQFPGKEQAVGNWNRLVIEMRNQKVKVEINGGLTSQFDLDELSKLPGSFPGLKRATGRIGLQSQLNQVRFRNIRIASIAPDGIAQATPGEPLLAKESVMRPDAWSGLGEFWGVGGSQLVGSTAGKKLEFNTCYFSKKSYQDFELTCQAKLTRNNSGIQIRSEIVDAAQGIMKGPQVDMGRGYWGSLYGERTSGLMQPAPAGFEDRCVKEKGFNDIFIRCVGKHVTVKINGQTSVDRDFPEMAPEGFIGFQLAHGDTQVMFRNIQITELGKTP